jgi:hypothetical protein
MILSNGQEGDRQAVVFFLRHCADVSLPAVTRLVETLKGHAGILLWTSNPLSMHVCYAFAFEGSGTDR